MLQYLVLVMVAQLQKLIVLMLLVATSSTFLWLMASGHLAFAFGAALMILCGHAFFLAGEFVLLSLTDVKIPASVRPSIGKLGRAWLIECVTTPRVFYWEQPFRSKAEPDYLPDHAVSRRGVVLVHGMFCNRGFWNAWIKRLRARQIPCIAVTLEPMFGSIDAYRAAIEASVACIESVTALPPIIVGHSMGGLAVRSWLAAYQADSRAHHIFTIATPHRGTLLAKFSRAANGKQMRIASSWLKQLVALDSPARLKRTTCFYSNCDNVVFPSHCATLDGASNRLLPGLGHVRLAFETQIFDAVCLQLTTSTLASERHDDAR